MFLSGMLARGRTRIKAGPPGGRARAARWVLAAAWLSGIFYLSHQSSPPGGTADGWQASAVHGGLYAGAALLLHWALAGSARCPGEAAWVLPALGFALAVLYGVGDELHQALVPGRVASEGDLAVDALGALVGVSLPLLASKLAGASRKAPRESP